jgi:hypothetical protein
LHHLCKSFIPSFRFTPNRGPRLKELKMGLNRPRTSAGELINFLTGGSPLKGTGDGVNERRRGSIGCFYLDEKNIILFSLAMILRRISWSARRYPSSRPSLKLRRPGGCLLLSLAEGSGRAQEKDAKFSTRSP